ncbi:hypothetical protein GCM10011348_14280 [Marinobacterium nitratireducens]|uniref:Uncharacterized protein n=1 Tax=Marinobacterium nitratireducens TaxID=518897 RepID=A0A917ZCW0_9GAMM|nr:hypothetical protein [Marinobacterium nitratireducens]GGO79600.1 hypothetical protein GCM10011348_14280 [Marinobacterium nitratireducens]
MNKSVLLGLTTLITIAALAATHQAMKPSPVRQLQLAPQAIQPDDNSERG